jgi:hypothetical protein
MSESKGINDVWHNDIKDRERAKEYTFPPLPNLVNAKKAYLK